jgi:hypothetical protein
MSNIIPIAPAAKPYRHLGRRVVNIHTGILGTITEARVRPNVKRGWSLTITWDDGHSNSMWTDRDVSAKGVTTNTLVADDYVPDYGPVKDRIQKLIDRIDHGDVRWKYGYGVEGRCGRDHIHIWKPRFTSQFEVRAGLYGGQGKWEAEGITEELAWQKLRSMLVEALANLTPEKP